MHHMKMQPSEIENMFYYEYHYHLRELSAMLKEQQKDSEKQESAQNDQMAAMKSSMPKMPNMSAPKMPNIKMPKL